MKLGALIGRTGRKAKEPARVQKKRPAAVAPSRQRARARKGALWRLWRVLSTGEIRMMPAYMAMGGFLLVALGYGLVIGGYVDQARNHLAAAGDRLLRDAGFAITDIRIDGRRNADRKAVIEALNVTTDNSIFAFDLAAAKWRIERLGWVRSARIIRLLPNSIVVRVTERKPMAIWQRGGRLSVIDEEGVPLSENRVADYASLPLVVGYSAAAKARRLIEMMVRQPEIGARMRAAIRVGNRRWNILLRNSITIMLPETAPDKALKTLVQLDRDQGLLERDIKSIDFRLPGKLTIRLGDDAAAMRSIKMGKASARGKRT